MTGWLEHLGRAVSFAGSALVAALASPLRLPRPTARLVSSTLFGALPLASMLGIAIGAVIYLQTGPILGRLGASDYLPVILSVAVFLELAPVGAGLILAARSGAALGAELGAMRNTEQLDALILLGVSPTRRLVGPRVAACALALPLLAVWVALLALASGYLAEWATRGTGWTTFQAAFLTGSRSELYFGDMVVAMIKTPVFGYLVGVAGCRAGLTAPIGTTGVGTAATRGVVFAALLVLVAEVAIVGIKRALG